MRAGTFHAIATLFLAAAVWACSTHQTRISRPTVRARQLTVWVDSQFTPAERREIESAIRAWNRALNGYAELTPTYADDDRYWSDIEVDWEPEHEMPASPGHAILAFVSQIGNRDIHVFEGRMKGEPLAVVVAHEIGHSLGLTHGESGTLMAPSVEHQTACIDADTLRRLARQRGWDFRHMVPGCGQ